ncbi:MAG: DNA-deoxyinosine glycosylase [Chloroflexi bacterium]|nr:DNA-deoxyinosine glycosylase [Chloroflexota bacterium]
MNERQQNTIELTHPLEPLYDKNSHVLILGSFPSPASRKALFYYGHPQNRFWKVLSSVLNQELPPNNQEKKAMCLKYGVAIWDVLQSCKIKGAADSSIRKAIPNNLSFIFKTAPIKAVFTIGSTANILYNKFLKDKLGMQAIALPSTSSANNRYNMQDLIKAYQQILLYIK